MNTKSQSFRSDLGRVRGLGSAKDGTHHWWMMKISSFALIPLTFWFVISVLDLVGGDQVAIQQWLKHPLQAITLLLFIGFSLHHSANGLQTVMEDYIHSPFYKTVLLVANKLVHVVLAAVAAFSIITLALKN
ncbi:MAG: succinate dehydrogenase, hydrophobic membrane anchor protein [Alphaproteobacteria bacterium]|nr:succinate dehydrogenase, hydrophobic membrane anchor protein [Alphaproteobacteria bacterium]